MLSTLLTKDTVRVQVAAKNWEEAIRIGGALLKDVGAISQNYIEEMVKSMKTLGPYIVIAPGIAMPHARPEMGVNKLGLSLITLKQPIFFGNPNNDPVKLVLCLAASNETEHIEAMAELVSLLSDAQKIKNIEKYNEIASVLEIISN